MHAADSGRFSTLSMGETSCLKSHASLSSPDVPVIFSLLGTFINFVSQLYDVYILANECQSRILLISSFISRLTELFISATWWLRNSPIKLILFEAKLKLHSFIGGSVQRFSRLCLQFLLIISWRDGKFQSVCNHIEIRLSSHLYRQKDPNARL